MEPWIYILIVEICILLFGIWIVWSAVVGAPWLPTPKKRVRAMLDIAKVGPQDVVYDLGSGDGRIIVMAAKDYGANSVGIEIDPLRLYWSKLNIWRHRMGSKVKVIRGNFFKLDLSEATVVTLYQGHEINKKIRDKLAENLRPGTRVVSYRFILSGWTPTETNKESSTFLYIA
ncbi:MAG: SAM-dependent methyltransferase [Candidatus Thorarchaeota archaeon]